jgi:hypothetical protein
MPPRYTYWTILIGGQPTAFRAATRDELLPTLKQLQSTQPDAVMMWFSRGKVWPSEEAAAMAFRMEREGPRRERRGADWRPGGEHKDPRDRFKVPRDVKRQRFASRLRRDRTEEAPPAGDKPPGARPTGPKGSRPAETRPFRPKGDRPFQPKGDRPFQPKGDRPFQPKGDRPQGFRPSRPQGDRPEGARPFRPKSDRPEGFRPSRPKGDRPAEARPFRPKGPRGGGKPGGSYGGGGKKGGGGGRGPR